MHLFIILIIYFSFKDIYLWAENVQDKKQIRVLIEGEEEEKDHQDKKPYIVLREYNKKGEEQRLKDMAIKENIESEVLDALISKVVDLEDNMKILNILIIINFIVLLIVILFLTIKKK